jgi:hypothetical protein
MIIAKTSMAIGQKIKRARVREMSKSGASKLADLDRLPKSDVENSGGRAD